MAGQLPYGLKQVVKMAIDQNKHQLIDFDNIDNAMKQYKEQAKKFSQSR